MIAVGSRLGEYEILAQVRAGGMATLFRGRRAGAAGFAREVAIKVIHPHLATDPTLRALFVNEALLSSRVHDPNVVHIEEFGQADGTYFLVMEYVDGASLADVLAGQSGRALPVEIAVGLALEIAKGLHAAHEATDARGEPLRLVHRDVSPQNVLLTRAGHVKLIDFGIAKAEGFGAGTRSGAIRGKLRYMAPEQALRRPLDRRTDVFALGVLLWEMLTSRRFYEAVDDFELLDAVRAPNVVPPSCYVTGLDAALDAAVLRALAFEPDARFESADAFRRALAQACPAARDVDAAQLAALVAQAPQPAVTESTGPTRVEPHATRADAPPHRARRPWPAMALVAAACGLAMGAVALRLRPAPAASPRAIEPAIHHAESIAPSAPTAAWDAGFAARPEPTPAVAVVAAAEPRPVRTTHHGRHAHPPPHATRTVHDVPMIQHSSF